MTTWPSPRRSLSGEIKFLTAPPPLSLSLFFPTPSRRRPSKTAKGNSSFNRTNSFETTNHSKRLSFATPCDNYRVNPRKVNVRERWKDIKNCGQSKSEYLSRVVRMCPVLSKMSLRRVGGDIENLSVVVHCTCSGRRRHSHRTRRRDHLARVARRPVVVDGGSTHSGELTPPPPPFTVRPSDRGIETAPRPPPHRQSRSGIRIEKTRERNRKREGSRYPKFHSSL